MLRVCLFLLVCVGVYMVVLMMLDSICARQARAVTLVMSRSSITAITIRIVFLMRLFFLFIFNQLVLGFIFSYSLV